MNFKLGRFEQAIALARKSLQGADERETSELSKIIGESYFNLKDYRSALPYLLEYDGKRGNGPIPIFINWGTPTTESMNTILPSISSIKLSTVKTPWHKMPTTIWQIVI